MKGQVFHILPADDFAFRDDHPDIVVFVVAAGQGEQAFNPVVSADAFFDFGQHPVGFTDGRARGEFDLDHDPAVVHFGQKFTAQPAGKEDCQGQYHHKNRQNQPTPS